MEGLLGHAGRSYCENLERQESVEDNRFACKHESRPDHLRSDMSAEEKEDCC